MISKILVTKTCGNKAEKKREEKIVQSLGSTETVSGAGECGNTLVLVLTIERDDATTAITLLKDSGFETQWYKNTKNT